MKTLVLFRLLREKVVHLAPHVLCPVSFLNPYLHNGLAHPNQMDKSISNFGGIWCTFSFLLHF